MRYDYQIYSILETVAALDQQVVIHLLSTLTQSLKDSERKWGLGRNIAQRYIWIILHLWAMITKSRFIYWRWFIFPFLKVLGMFFDLLNVSILQLTYPFTCRSFQSDHLRYFSSAAIVQNIFSAPHWEGDLRASHVLFLYKIHAGKSTLWGMLGLLNQLYHVYLMSKKSDPIK